MNPYVADPDPSSPTTIGAQTADAPEAVLAVADAIRRIVRALRVSARGAESAVGLSGAQLFVLQKLSAGAPCSLGELAARTHTHQSSVSVVVGRLVEKKLVTRKRSKEDTRRVDIALTASGRRLLSGAPDMAQAALFAALGSLPAPEQHELARLLGRVVRAMGAEDTSAGLFFEDDPEGDSGSDAP